jgi:hypothetical protein
MYLFCSMHVVKTANRSDIAELSVELSPKAIQILPFVFFPFVAHANPKRKVQLLKGINKVFEEKYARIMPLLLSYVRLLSCRILLVAK